MENIKKQYEAETGESWENSQGEPDIDYVEWLENKINTYETLGVFPKKTDLNKVFGAMPEAGELLEEKTNSMEKVKLFNLCFATYPINKSVSTDVDLYYCIPIKIGPEYSTCHLFSGELETRLYYKGRFTDVCTNDLQPLNHKNTSNSAQKKSSFCTNGCYLATYLREPRV